jgi:hypothetical protein
MKTKEEIESRIDKLLTEISLVEADLCKLEEEGSLTMFDVDIADQYLYDLRNKINILKWVIE